VETGVPPNIKTSRNWGLMNFLYALRSRPSAAWPVFFAVSDYLRPAINDLLRLMN